MAGAPGGKRGSEADPDGGGVEKREPKSGGKVERSSGDGERELRCECI